MLFSGPISTEIKTNIRNRVPIAQMTKNVKIIPYHYDFRGPCRR